MFSADSGEFIELGAQWIHGEDHPVYEFVKRHGLVLDKSTDSLIDEDEATGHFVLDCGRRVNISIEQCHHSNIVPLRCCDGRSSIEFFHY